VAPGDRARNRHGHVIVEVQLKRALKTFLYSDLRNQLKDLIVMD
jgi:hypothetical protein